VELDAKQIGPSPALVDQLHSQLTGKGFRVAILRTRWGSLDALKELCRVAARLEASHLHLQGPAKDAIMRAELVNTLQHLSQVAAREKVTLLLGNRPDSHADTPVALVNLIEAVGSSQLKASYDPAAATMVGSSPFYDGLYKGSLRQLVEHVELRDMVADGGQAARLRYGNAEIQEIVSNLRCRTFKGFMCLWPLPAQGQVGFRVAAKSFWEILDSI
jgi:sugar phosphate isomerase/epimerase